METLLRSAGVGLVATIADLLALLLLVQVADLPPAVANVPALLIGIAVQFLGNKLVAFREPSRAWGRQGALFMLVEAGALTLNALLFHMVVTATPVPYAAARVASSSFVYFAYSYPLWGLVFRRS
jgi:putative flippase GtrA